MPSKRTKFCSGVPPLICNPEVLSEVPLTPGSNCKDLYISTSPILGIKLICFVEI